MRNTLKKVLVFIALEILVFVPASQTQAIGIDYGLIANMTNNRYTATGIENFTQKLKHQYIPILLANITDSFTSAVPTVNNLKIGLEYTFDPSSTKAPMFMESNGIQYKLSINLAKLSSGGGEVVVDDQFYGNLNHELMHAVMFDITTIGMIGKSVPVQSSLVEVVDALPMWFYEGIAQAIGGGAWHTRELFDQIYPKTPESDRKEMLKNWLDKHEWLGSTSYAQGWVATMYLGHIISNESTVNGPAIASGLDKILIDMSNGYSFSQSISRLTNNRYTSLDDFNNRFAEDGQDFAIQLVEAIGPTSVSCGSAVVHGGLTKNGQDLFYAQNGRSNFFELDISKIGAYDNTTELTGKPILTGGGRTKTEGTRRDGSINPDASLIWPAPATPPSPGVNPNGQSSTPSTPSSTIPQHHSSSRPPLSSQKPIAKTPHQNTTTDHQPPLVSTERPINIDKEDPPQTTSKDYRGPKEDPSDFQQKPPQSQQETPLVLATFGGVTLMVVVGFSILFIKTKHRG